MSQKNKLRLIALVIMSLVISLVTLAVVGGCFFTSLHKKTVKAPPSRYKLLIGIEDGDKESFNVHADKTVRGGVRFTDFTRLSDFLKWTTVRNGKDIRFYLNNEDEDMLFFTLGDDVVYVNGNPVRLMGASFEMSEHIYLPLDFVASSFDGISVVENKEKNTVTIEYMEPKKCSLKLKFPEALKPLSENEFVNNG